MLCRLEQIGPMDQLSAKQLCILGRAVTALQAVKGVRAIVLGGSHARGRARADSDLDIGLYYDRAVPLDIAAIATIAGDLNDTPDPVVSPLYGWGRWVNGGAWLTIEGQRVDFLYRSLDDVERTLSEAQAGRFEIDAEQQPPFGFFGPTVLGEVVVARSLFDPHDVVAGLKRRVSPMPEPLMRAVVRSRLWNVEFGLKAFAPKFAASGDAYGVAGCLTRFAFSMVLALFALNRTYLLNDKTALDEIETFAIAPGAFGARLTSALAAIGTDAASQNAAIDAVTALFEDVRVLAGDLYAPAWRY
jgi:predicted nucleotidyltransferase